MTPNKRKGQAYGDAIRIIEELQAELERLRSLLWVDALCGGCGKTYSYNRADDPNGDVAGEPHGHGKCC